MLKLNMILTKTFKIRNVYLKLHERKKNWIFQ